MFLSENNAVKTKYCRIESTKHGAGHIVRICTKHCASFNFFDKSFKSVLSAKDSRKQCTKHCTSLYTKNYTKHCAINGRKDTLHKLP